ncbi:hypothetical protein CN514_04115 [Bacillus sp. AFS001701]|uniref:hypothetical protein n=1 Tax=Bacillus sp. AFS001701 TaxID=2033480 RepID=UPI000BF73526|nr:hypothetical protein [Bacillus sp. AFS001701]PET75423.1 hypothetical protein CN514_04115 [Bacillus sp. AFS001701]
MDLKTLEQYKPHIPFQVIEKDLNRDPILRRKTFFDENDAKIEHNADLLSNGNIIIPIFKEKIIRPIGFKAKLLDYVIENMGCGFYIITYKRGKATTKSNDLQHAHEEIDKKITIYIAYDHKGKKYKFFEKKNKFLQMYKEIEELKYSNDVQNIINNFIDWIQTFWKTEFKVKHNFGMNTSNQTYQNHLDVIEELEKSIPTLESYHLLLNLFGDITDESLKKINETINALKERMDKAKNIINEHFPNPNVLVDHTYFTDLGYGAVNPILAVSRYLEDKILERGYFIDRENDTIHPTIGELFIGNQFSNVYESVRSKKERIIELKDKAITSNKDFFIYTPPEKKQK